MEKIIIVAVSENYVIGKEGRMPWHSKEDLKHFKATTMGHPVIMGRRTFESLGKPLKGRTNIVITRNNTLQEEFEGVVTFDKLNDAYNFCQSQGEEKIFIIGGGQLYNEALPDADKLVVTHMHLKVEGDTYFPEIKQTDWKLVSEERFDEFDIREYQRN